MRRLSFCLMLAIGLPMAFPAASPAQDFSPQAIEKANPYKDLPGVEDPGKKDPVTTADRCWTEVRMAGERLFGNGGDRAPVVVYVCEKNGVTMESTDPPRRSAFDPLREP